MDSQTIIKLNVIETPLKFKSSTQTIINPTFKNTPYSSYLKPKEDPTQNLSQENDTELSIFDAQKYFSETNEPKDIIIIKKQQPQQQEQPIISPDSLLVQRLSSVSSVDGYNRNFRTRSFRATPTASSEASWNSQTGLLSNPPGSIEVNLNSDNGGNKRNNNYFTATKWFFARKCCCSGEKSVQVKKVASTSSSSSSSSSSDQIEHNLSKLPQNNNKEDNIISGMDVPRQHRISASGRPFIEGFSFPILKPYSNQAMKKGIIGNPVIVNPIRKPLDNHYNNSSNSPGGCYNPGSPITVRDEDLGSDASSDLFELESFSTQTTTSYPMYRRRDSLDEDSRKIGSPVTPSVAATECYAPSEVSIDWSVATAEGWSVSAAEEADGGAGRRRGGGGGLMMMGCRAEKAVSVGPHAVKCCVAEGPPMFPLRHAGGRPPRGEKGAAPARVSLAFAA